MNTAAWLLIAFAVLVAVGGTMWMRNMFRKSREQQKRIDWSKIRRWEDEDDDWEQKR